jgi:hypothetical protein
LEFCSSNVKENGRVKLEYAEMPGFEQEVKAPFHKSAGVLFLVEFMNTV